jgi:MerR family mercuric resistance operon transcriptional regulator
MGGLPSISIEYLSKRSGVDERTIRRYQRLGLVRNPRTVTPGFLLYTSEDVDRIRFARSALNLGFQPAAVRELLDLADHKSKRCCGVKEISERHLHDIRRRIADLQKMADILTPLTSECTSDMTISECPIVEAITGGALPLT